MLVKYRPEIPVIIFSYRRVGCCSGNSRNIIGLIDLSGKFRVSIRIVADDSDNCPAAANPGQADFNENGTGDACEDTDGDGVLDAVDNCRSIANPGQEPSSVNASCGEACETASCVGVICENF